MKKYIIKNGNKYDADKITFVAFCKLYPNATKKDFKDKTGREALEPKEVIKKVIKKVINK